jgi:hypothetical protein
MPFHTVCNSMVPFKPSHKLVLRIWPNFIYSSFTSVPTTCCLSIFESKKFLEWALTHRTLKPPLSSAIHFFHQLPPPAPHGASAQVTHFQEKKSTESQNSKVFHSTWLFSVHCQIWEISAAKPYYYGPYGLGNIIQSRPFIFFYHWPVPLTLWNWDWQRNPNIYIILDM